MTTLKIAPYTGNADLFGKTASDLQSGLSINNTTVNGTSKYIADYSSAFGPDMDSGNYIALHAEVPDEDDVTITLTNKIGKRTIRTGTLDSDGILVLYIQDKEAQTITFTASKEGYEDVSKTIRLTGLTLEEEE